MSSGPSSSSSGSTSPTAPPFINKLSRASGAAELSGLNAANAAGGLPSLLNQPPQGVAPLTSQQTGNINQLENIANGGSPDMNSAESQLAALTGGPIGSSPATIAAMQAYNQNIEPTITSSLGASGPGRGGELAAALTQGQTNAYVPLIQQEIGNRENAVGQYSSLAGQNEGNIQSALTAAGLPQQNQQQILDALFNQQQQKSGLIQGLTQGPLAQFGNSLIGGVQQSTTSQNSGKF